jgi:hypothetical protein
MNKRWTASALGMALALAVGMARPVAAYKQPPPPGAHKSKTATTQVQSTVTGIIKGAPAGTVYTVVSGNRSMAVDAGKATIRNKGKFASRSDLKPGAFIKAQGTSNGTTVAAKTVDILKPAGGSKKGGSTKSTSAKSTSAKSTSAKK